MKVKSKGFTLIETIVGMVVLSISFAVLTSLLYPATEQSASVLHQIRGAELAQSMLNEIQQKAFDENSDKSGGRLRCGETGIAACSTSMGNEEANERKQFDDVDDYHGLIYNVGEIEDSQENALDYLGYTLSVKVGNDSDYNGVTYEEGDTDDNRNTAKLITVTVTTPTGYELTFSTYRTNH
ncbi:type II secretion system protein [Thalassotalea sp. PP2-459]|uniref:type II secretion system protein n=1 Tax=Thalassotalea sp. PP2-459 TaxID=1742724 RepID=UPI0009443FF4|nr:type II secretion system protein [Thalassotalea sp. PP2-459]OKY24859.1 hypothetical protein BI291_04675 [Thalassotalea sp. PP2-459]